ncbi:MAG: PIG-L family deacetylase [Anaerolineae bacterium]|nr:PIG-L family deacetylase [Anaerolineae bacterium]
MKEQATGADEGTPLYDAIYLSPHPDDAPLSCGGQIYQRSKSGERVLIVTLAAGEPQTEVRSIFAEFQHHNWGLDEREVMMARREEDARAVARLGAEHVTWSLPDAIYRLHPDSGEPLYTSNDDLFGPLSPAEAPLIAELAAQMATLPPARCTVSPLCLGNHVDHQLVRTAAERAFSDLLYYEDYPYVQRHPDSLGTALQPPDAWKAVLYPLDEEAIAARIEAILAYESQIGVLFNHADAMARLVREQVAATGGERSWYRP